MLYDQTAQEGPCHLPGHTTHRRGRRRRLARRPGGVRGPVRPPLAAHPALLRQRVLRLRSTDPRKSERYVETLYLDAGTGVMKRFVGGVDGRPPDVVVSYAIERVNAATVRGR